MPHDYRQYCVYQSRFLSIKEVQQRILLSDIVFFQSNRLRRLLFVFFLSKKPLPERWEAATAVLPPQDRFFGCVGDPRRLLYLV